MEKIDSSLKDDLQNCLTTAFADEATQKKIDSAIQDVSQKLFDSLEWQIKDDLATNLANWVAEMAQRAVEALLEGNDDQMRRYLSCEKRADSGEYAGWTGRSDGTYWGRQRGADEWHPVIHGKLFETGAMALRKQIVDAHRDVLVTERILDLEDQVKSLVAQVNKLEAEKEQLHQRYRESA